MLSVYLRWTPVRVIPEDVADGADDGARVYARRFRSPAIAAGRGAGHRPLPLLPAITATFARATRASWWAGGDFSAREFRLTHRRSSRMYRSYCGVPLDDSRRSPPATPPASTDAFCHTRTSTGISCTWKRKNEVEKKKARKERKYRAEVLESGWAARRVDSPSPRNTVIARFLKQYCFK